MGFEWANDDSRLFLSRGYIDGNMTTEERVRMIAQAAEEILDGRSMGLVSYELGGTPGASHGLIIYGKDENDVQLTLRKIQKTKAFRDYIASRGKVDYIQTYQVKTAKRF